MIKLHFQKKDEIIEVSKKLMKALLKRTMEDERFKGACTCKFGDIAHYGNHVVCMNCGKGAARRSSRIRARQHAENVKLYKERNE